MRRYEKQVKAGIAFLDSYNETHPHLKELENWRERVDLETLDLNHASLCVLSQIFGCNFYTVYASILDLSYEQAATLGFVLSVEVLRGTHKRMEIPAYGGVSMRTYEKQVKAGIAFLDTYNETAVYPLENLKNWRTRVNWETLDMRFNHLCLLAQILGSTFYRALGGLGITYEQSGELGFMLPHPVPVGAYQSLQAEWKVQLTEVTA